MKKFFTGSSMLAIAVASAGSFTGAQAQSQAQTDDEEFVLEEIIVSARRRDESLKDAPQAINVMSEDYLIKQRVESISDALELTPGASFVRFSKVQPEKVMRGIVAPTPGNSSSEQSIQTAIDGMVVSKDFMKAPAVYDIDRVEILRGPQGTTFGRNASIGLISIITKRPTREFEAGINGTMGTDELFEVDGYVSGPLSDTLSARLAFNFDSEDGPTESISTGEGLNGDSNFSVRGSFLYEPNDNFTAFLKVEYSHDDDEAPVRRGADCSTPYIDGPQAVVNLAPPLSFQHPPFATTFIDSCDVFKTEISSDTDFFLKRDILTVFGELAWQVADGVTLTSITGYMDGDNDALADVLGSPENIVFQAVQNNGYMLSEELRIDNHGTDNQLRWIFGLYYLEDQEDRFEENRFFQNNALPFPRVPSFLATISTNKTKSIAVFGELTYDLSDKLELAVGGRWTRDDKDYTYSVRASGFRPVIAGVTGCVPPGIICGSVENPVGFAPIPISNDWSDFTAKASLRYQVNDNNTLYALWSQGFKSGGFQPDARTPEQASVPFDPEHSNNYELGWKAEHDRARFNLTAFYLKNEGNQTVTLIPVGTGFAGLIANFGSIVSKGIEAEATVLVTPNLTMGGSGALIDAEIRDANVLEGIDTDGNEIFNDISGIRADSAPKWTAVVWAEYEFHLDGGSSLSFRGDFMGRSDILDDITARDTRARLRPSIGNFGARITWLSEDENLRVMLWGENLNEDYDIDNVGPSQPNTLQLPVGFTHKRAYGVTMGYKF